MPGVSVVCAVRGCMIMRLMPMMVVVNVGVWRSAVGVHHLMVVVVMRSMRIMLMCGIRFV
jgi:hypothetical protein